MMMFRPYITTGMSHKLTNSLDIRIRRAAKSDVDGIMAVMEEAVQSLPHPDWFVSDNREFIQRNLSGRGFVLVSEVKKNFKKECIQKKNPGAQIAGFFVVRFPGLQEDNLGIHLTEYQMAHHKTAAQKILESVAHFESAAVRLEFRGCHLQAAMFAEAEKLLCGPDFELIQRYMGTVHPDNQASLKSFMDRGFEVLDVVEKYGGLKRCVVAKKKI